MALLRAPCGLLAPSSNVGCIASTSSSSSQLLVPRLSVRNARTYMSLLASHGKDENKYGLFASDNTGLSARGKEIVEDSVTAYSAASEAAASMPVKSTEQEEYAKEWAHKPRRIVLFVEPSPFSYVFISLLQIRLCSPQVFLHSRGFRYMCRFSTV